MPICLNLTHPLSLDLSFSSPHVLGFPAYCILTVLCKAPSDICTDQRIHASRVLRRLHHKVWYHSVRHKHNVAIQIHVHHATNQHLSPSTHLSQRGLTLLVTIGHDDSTINIVFPLLLLMITINIARLHVLWPHMENMMQHNAALKNSFYTHMFYRIPQHRVYYALVLTSPQYSDMKSFFSHDSLRKIPQPATSDGAISRCCVTHRVHVIYTSLSAISIHNIQQCTSDV